jgi:lambda family phage portal protein
MKNDKVVRATRPGFIDLLSTGLSRLTPKAFGGGSFGIGGGGQSYDAASAGRRLAGWNGSILGPNTISLATWEQLIRRSRDAVRNTALASSAIDHFQSNMIGTGIVPHFTHPDPTIRAAIQKEWDRWVKKADWNGQRSFFGLQSLACREIFEAGEVFCRFHVVDDDESYFKVQLIESEQVPVFLTMQSGVDEGTVIKEGLIFDKHTDKRLGYRIYKGQPYDTVVNWLDSTQFINITTDEMIQVVNLLRAGQLRGVPIMAPVMALLYDLEGYSDAERLRKRLAAMFAFFIEQPTAEGDVVTAFADQATGRPVEDGKIEPGTMNILLPGEKITSPEVPESGGYAEFMYCELHKFAQACKITYEQLTGDMKGVTFSSARVAMLEFRRSAEQFQLHVIIDQLCEPIMKRWMKEAVLSGALELPDDYVSDPEQYEVCTWVPDGFEWVDPVKEAQSAQMAVRSGFISRSMIIRQRGFDPATIDAEIATERQREKELGIVTDTNANVVLIGRETVPDVPTVAKPDQNAKEEADENEDADES